MQVKYQFHTNHIGMLEGRVLTLVDATFGDPEQRKAFKDVIRQTIWEWAIGNNEATDDEENRVKDTPEERPIRS